MAQSSASRVPRREAPFDARRSHWPAMVASMLLHGGCLIAIAWTLTVRSRGTFASPEVRSVGMAVTHRMPDRTRYVTEPQPSRERQEGDSEDQPAAAAPQGGSPSPAANSQSGESESTNPDSNNRESGQPAAAVSGLTPPIDFGDILSRLARPTAGVNGRAGGPAEGQAGGSAGPSTGPGMSAIAGKIELADGRSPDELTTGELTPARARTGLGAGRTTTQVFGVSGTGSTFVYVFDRSESMVQPRSAPLRASKTELIRSLRTLTEKQQFQIIFYNERPEVFRAFGDRTGLVLGEPATIARAIEFVERTTATGGTEHELALKLALRLTPDVLFFLTDAKIQTLSDASLDDLTRRAQDAGTTIHTIQFGSGPSSPATFAERLAELNGGQYRYVDVGSLE